MTNDTQTDRYAFSRIDIGCLVVRLSDPDARATEDTAWNDDDADGYLAGSVYEYLGMTAFAEHYGNPDDEPDSAIRAWFGPGGTDQFIEVVRQRNIRRATIAEVINNCIAWSVTFQEYDLDTEQYLERVREFIKSLDLDPDAAWGVAE